MKNGKVVVLYLEDEPNLAELLRAGLGMFGMIVSPIYCSAEELLGKTSSVEFIAADIMVLDIRLPGLTGLELAKRLRDQGEKRPIVIVSAFNRPDQSVLDEIGAIFQPKPFDFQAIVHTIQALVKYS
jgi:two-component system response regulator MprA